MELSLGCLSMQLVSSKRVHYRNAGCPAPTVNRHRGGAALLGEPELINCNEIDTALLAAGILTELPLAA